MVIEYVCEKCKESVVDVELVIRRKCPTCSIEMEQIEWEGLGD